MEEEFREDTISYIDEWFGFHRLVYGSRSPTFLFHDVFDVLRELAAINDLPTPDSFTYNWRGYT